jgi:hypothetical protein
LCLPKFFRRYPTNNLSLVRPLARTRIERCSDKPIATVSLLIPAFEARLGPWNVALCFEYLPASGRSALHPLGIGRINIQKNRVLPLRYFGQSRYNRPVHPCSVTERNSIPALRYLLLRFPSRVLLPFDRCISGLAFLARLCEARKQEERLVPISHQQGCWFLLPSLSSPCRDRRDPILSIKLEASPMLHLAVVPR